MKATCIISLAFPQTKSTNKSTDLVNIESTHSIVTEKNEEKCAGKTALVSSQQQLVSSHTSPVVFLEVLSTCVLSNVIKFGFPLI